MGFKLFRSKVPGAPSYNYNPEIEKPIIKASICNGEQVAGFKNRDTGHFREITLIRTPAELDTFMKQCGISEITKEY